MIVLLATTLLLVLFDLLFATGRFLGAELDGFDTLLLTEGAAFLTLLRWEDLFGAALLSRRLVPARRLLA